MMTASLRQPDAEIDGESVWRAATKSVVWRGGEAAGPPWGDRVMPLRAARHLRGLASSLSAGELRMQVRGKKKRVEGVRKMCHFRRGVGVSVFHRCKNWKWCHTLIILANWDQDRSSDCLVSILSASEHFQVCFHPCKFNYCLSKRSPAHTAAHLRQSLKKIIKKSNRSRLTNRSNTDALPIKPTRAHLSAVCVLFPAVFTTNCCSVIPITSILHGLILSASSMTLKDHVLLQ